MDEELPHKMAYNSQGVPGVAPSVSEQASPQHQNIFPFASRLTPHKKILSNPAIESVRNLFPDEISNSIEILPHPTKADKCVAALSMTFPSEPSEDKHTCRMYFQIQHHRLQHLAREWYGVRLEAKDGIRYMATASGGEVVGRPRFALQGFAMECLLDTLGKEVFDALSKTPEYQENRVPSRADCVWMSVSFQAEATAHVYMPLSLEEGTRIARKLFEKEDLAALGFD